MGSTVYIQVRHQRCDAACAAQRPERLTMHSNSNTQHSTHVTRPDPSARLSTPHTTHSTRPARYTVARTASRRPASSRDRANKERRLEWSSARARRVRRLRSSVEASVEIPFAACCSSATLHCRFSSPSPMPVWLSGRPSAYVNHIRRATSRGKSPASPSAARPASSIDDV